MVKEISIYKNYTQKSRIFLYPILGIPKGARYIPIESYLSFKDGYSINDYRLICLYNKSQDENFQIFSKNIIKKCNLFEKTIKHSETEELYIFNFNQYRCDWNNIINGKYSKLTSNYKWKILNFHRNNQENFELVKKILFPNQHFQEFAEYLGVDTKLIKDVGELLDKPNFEKEALKF